MDVIIRNVKEEDLPSVVDIKIKGWQSAYKDIVDSTYLNNLNNEYDIRIEKKLYDKWFYCCSIK